MRGPRTWGWASLVLVVAVAGLGLVAVPAAVLGSTSPTGSTTVLPGHLLVAAPPSWAKGPDDLTQLSVHGLDSGRALIWTEFQNGIDPNGSPSYIGGPTQSEIAGFDPLNGLLVRSINVSGHIDGLTADPATGQLVVTSNEDANSFLAIVDPRTGSVTQYTYAPSPEVSGNGGTDSIAIEDGQLFISHSNPSDTTQATTYSVQLHPSTLIATLTPVFWDNSWATDTLTGASVQLALTDPDTNYVMPDEGERFAGDLATISQGDGKIIFASHVPSSSPKLDLLNLTDNVTGNLPPIDGLAVTTCDRGTLYVVDAAANTITALDTTGWSKGTTFVTEPDDNSNPLIGTLDLTTGVITPLGNHFVSPKGLLFTPAAGCGSSDHGGHHSHHGHDRGRSSDGATFSPLVLLEQELARFF
jgi:hypothetical protein